MKLFLVLLAVFSYSLQAEIVRGRIDSVDYGEEDSHLILLENGFVLFLDPSKEEMLHSALSGFKALQYIDFEVDGNQNVISLQEAMDDLPEADSSALESSSSVFNPTVFTDQKDAYSMFARMRDDFKDKGGQCYNMAHIWTYEEYLKNEILSTKLFMFFTTKYIRKYRFPWWFHVAPAVYVAAENHHYRLVLDRRYATYPMPAKEWSDIFVKSRRSCKEVKRMKEYYKSSQMEDCYFIETSMYFWQPKDIRIRDTEGKTKRSFFKNEIKYALKEAFQNVK